MKSKYVYSLFIFLTLTFVNILSAHPGIGHFHFGPGSTHEMDEGEEIHEEDDHFHFGPG